jgi:hypothetical protein
MRSVKSLVQVANSLLLPGLWGRLAGMQAHAHLLPRTLACVRGRPAGRVVLLDVLAVAAAKSEACAAFPCARTRLRARGAGGEGGKRVEDREVVAEIQRQVEEDCDELLDRCSETVYAPTT